MLSTKDLFSRLTEGHAAGVTVVTPNRRLAQALNLEFDSCQIDRNLTSWEAPDILPFGAFVERLWEDALYSDLGEKLPLLLTPAQEQRLWEEILADSGLLAIPPAAAQCRDAWGLLHAWRIGAGQGNEDAKAFSQWSKLYAQRTRGEVDAARLPDLILNLAQNLKRPKLLVAYAFDILPPQTKELLAAFEQHGVEVLHCAPERKAGKPVRAAFASAREELERAAAWARARLENRGRLPISPRIGVVVPQLEQRRAEL